ncbi:MAG: PfaD family polyunsaturated fatty acid/polyketide biosynthesis protein [Terracidiphilus sp.]
MMSAIRPDSLGCEEFKADYGLRYAYLGGGMYKGIASKEMVVALGRAGLMGFFGTGGLDSQEVEAAIGYIKAELAMSGAYGMNLLANIEAPELEARLIDLYLKHNVRNIEASGYMGITKGLVRWRLLGLRRGASGRIEPARRTLAKVSRPEVAGAFMQPAPAHLVKELIDERCLSPEEAELGQQIPMADDICVEADSGGHTDQGVALVLLPAMLILRDGMMTQYGYAKRIRVGAAGGIGTPHAAAAAFIMGADFLLTGSINQCTIEAGTSTVVKDILQDLNVQDTAYAPAGDMFEMGSQVQVVKRGLLFPSRAAKLYQLYLSHNAIEEIDSKTQSQIQDRFFRRSFTEVWNETREYYHRISPEKVRDIESTPKKRMAAIFKWYFGNSTRAALCGIEDEKVNYQIHCGPAIGAFNQWVKGSSLEHWQERDVARIGTTLMEEAAALLGQRVQQIQGCA